MSRCPGHGRHWFALWGHVGVRTPTCQRCGAPNPRPLAAGEQREYEAIKAYKAEAASDFHRHGCEHAPDEHEHDDYHDHEFGGAFDGHTVTSDADPGL